MNELVVISGKGGTGKTSLVASFAALAGKAVLADCDVDAADLHLILHPRVLRRFSFSGASRAHIRTSPCTACGKCEELCRFDALLLDGPGNGSVPKTYRVNPVACEGCGVCVYFCPEDAIELVPTKNGQWFVSHTRCGPMVHARLGVAEESSGKLVHRVRTEANRIAHEQQLDLVIIDGAPGIGCPVIASVTASDLVLVVTEPTLSGLHDLERVADLTESFGINTIIAVNKWDLNPELSAEIESRACARGVPVAGRVRYDRAVTDAQLQGQAVIEYTSEGAALDIRQLWTAVSGRLNQSSPLAVL